MAENFSHMASYYHSPIRTEKKNMGMGMLRIGDVTFKNQLGVMGKKRRKSRKKNRLLLFSST